jgi:Sulfotransferase domain
VRIHWLASYPYSGGTWVRFLLHQYLYGETSDSRELARTIPDIHQGPLQQAAAPDDLVIVRTRWRFTPQLPHQEETAGCIYVLRHPKDVALSAMNAARVGGVSLTDEQYLHQFIRHGGDEGAINAGLGAWEDHVFSWLRQRRVPMLTVRYSDLKQNTGGELRRMLDFLGKPADDQRIARAIRSSTFDRLREIEEREVRAGLKGSVFPGSVQQLERGGRVIRQGGTGQRLDPIALGLDWAFDERFGAALWLVGYGSTATAQA